MIFDTLSNCKGYLICPSEGSASLSPVGGSYSFWLTGSYFRSTG